jgi:serine protease Do
MAEALNVPGAGGFLVRQVAKDSIGGRIGLRGGDRIGIVGGQQVVVGGDVLLAVQKIPVASWPDIDTVLKALETLQLGDELRVTILRDAKVQELSMKWTGR